VLSLSSTAIVLQTLNEKGLIKSDGGQSGFSVLLFQDIAVIPMLAFIPLLALPELADTLQLQHAAQAGDEPGHGGTGFIESLQAWQLALVTVGAIAAVVVGGSFLTRPLFRFIAQTRLRELFTAAALMLVIAIAWLMMAVGLSPALGTFIAGVVLANSEYRHELESDIEPFKGLLLGLFFITVGAAIDFELLFENLGAILALTAGLILLKALVLFVLASVFGIRGSDRWLFSLGLAQAGEFGFVLLSFMVASAVLPLALAQQLLLVVALSMLMSPALFIFFDRIIAPRFASSQAREADEIDEEASIIIAGVGRFGQVINRILLSAGHRTVVLDHHAEHLEMVRIFGVKAFYGDATRPDLLQAAGIAKAKMLVVAIDDPEQSLELVRYVTQNYPQVYLVTRALDRHHVYELWSAGSRDIIRETFDSAVRAGRSALEALGHHPWDAERHARSYVRMDKKALRELAELYDPEIPPHLNEPYVKRTREYTEALMDAMRGQGSAFDNRVARAWAPPTADDITTVTGENQADEGSET